ncbi:MAG: hypothetical protein ACLVG5_03760 [Clostridium sp.]
MNLTAITEEGDVVAKHFCDSLCLVRHIMSFWIGSLKVKLKI